MPGYDPRDYDYSDDEPIEKLRVQARLHNKVRDGGRQRDAIKMWNWCKTQKWEDRKIITEALIALAVAMNEGYEPPINEQAVLTNRLQETIMAVADHVQMLSKLDLSTLRSQPAWNEQTWKASESLLSPESANLFGAAKKFEDDDD